jgi:hypothetical protein
MASGPTVMVSSTFYDLKQVRRDLDDFLGSQMGYQCLLSEMSSFPIDPDLDTIENCKRRVRDDADILVLIIGGRYGSIDSRTAKSVTNLEYLTARAKGIPIYVFIERKIVDMLHLWKDNQGIDFSKVVDTPQLFEFVDQIRTQDKTWTWPFDVAQDIVAALRLQFAHAQLQGLKLRSMLAGSQIPDHLNGVGPDALRVALEKPDSWEFLLFFHCLANEVERRKDRLRDYDAGLRLGLAENVPAIIAGDWVTTRIHELLGLLDSAGRLVNVEAQTAFGPPGRAGDASYIVWSAKKLGESLDFALEWSQRVRCARVDEPFEPVVAELQKFSADFIQQLREKPGEWLDAAIDAIDNSVPGQPRTLNFNITFSAHDTGPMDAALASAVRFYQGRQ